eukprot:Unigene7952_Nuclearia_a/m.24398 Unigene7952_Nuclearia_a/g.24398  ORF Unigene7952_Nuclearia_a/g.24398 Unigene7952_Nuclearia_a/m.24398 type:complete len:383 (-) Unigene7952_Nuclearia_a:71-1219(-)
MLAADRLSGEGRHGHFPQAHELNVRLLFGQQKDERAALLADPRRAPAAVHVRLERVRQVKVNDVVDPGNVQAARGHVGCNQHRRGAVLETVKVGQALALLHLRVQRVRGHVEQAQQLQQLLRRFDAIDKHERAPGERQQEVVQQQLLVVRGAHHVRLRQRRRDNRRRLRVKDARTRGAEVDSVDERVEHVVAIARVLARPATPPVHKLAPERVDHGDRGREDKCLARVLATRCRVVCAVAVQHFVAILGAAPHKLALAADRHGYGSRRCDDRRLAALDRIQDLVELAEVALLNHAVRLVNHEEVEAAQVVKEDRLHVAQKLPQPAGRRHDDLRLLVEVPLLLEARQAADDRRDAHGGELRHCGKVCAHLQRKLARRRENERA